MAPKEKEYLEIAHQRALEKKTHVSFPQLKYPSLRDEGIKDPVQWLMGKAMDDGAEGLWRVHNGLYDLDSFIDRHPGGAEWLELTKNTDITEAFECHHIGRTAEKMLEKFYIRDAKQPRNSPFTFKEDGFYRTLKNSVRNELEKIPKSTIRNSDMIIDSLFITCLISSSLSCWLRHYWLSMASYLVASLSLGWVVIASHNYLHRKNNWRMYLFNIGLWSYRDFRISHALSHHLYPNTLMDLEVSAFEPIIQWNPRDKSVFAKCAFLIEPVAFPCMFLLNFGKKFLLNFLRKDFFKRYYRWHDGIGLLLPLWMYITTGESFYQVFTTWFWILCTGSLVFFTIGSNAAHHHPKIFKDGDEVSTTTPDWGMHELEAVMDRVDVNDNHFKVMTLFGHHALHHLFPTLDHGVLKYLYPVLLENCQKFKANFRMTSSLDLFIGQIQMSIKTEPTLLCDRIKRE